MQVDAWERGFSYSYDAPLDMRMDPTQSLSAATIVNEWPQDRLAKVLRDLGEERRGGSIAREIVNRRPVETTAQLVPRSRRRFRPPSASAAATRRSGHSRRSVSPSTASWTPSTWRCPLAWEILPIGGRVGAISFHSLEDRRVKRFLADRARGCICPPELPV